MCIFNSTKALTLLAALVVITSSAHAVVRASADWDALAKSAHSRYACETLVEPKPGLIGVREYKTRLACHQVWLISRMSATAPGLGKQGEFSDRQFDPLIKDTELLEAETGIADEFQLSACKEHCVVNLRQAKLDRMRMSGRTLPPRLSFSDAELDGATFDNINLSGIEFERSSCRNCSFGGVDLSGANFDGANLQDAVIRMSKLDKTSFASSDLTHISLASNIAYLPAPSSMVSAKGLHTLRIGDTPSDEALALGLRDEFKRLGSREALRAINYSIRTNRSHYLTNIEYWFNTLFFDWTVGYGLYPARPLILLAFCLPIFAALYLLSMAGTDKKSGVFVVWDKERLDKSFGADLPRRLTIVQPFPRRSPPLPRDAPQAGSGVLPWFTWHSVEERAKRIRPHVLASASFLTLIGLSGWAFSQSAPGVANARISVSNSLAWGATLLVAATIASLWIFPSKHMQKAWQMSVWFSLLSGFRFGWRDLSLGTWLALVQTDEYTLKATGWVRSMAGLQSLLGLFLVALWAVCYFVGPLE